MTNRTTFLPLFKKTIAIIGLSGALSFTAQANLMTNYGAYVSTNTASNCPSYCTSANGGEFAFASDGGEFIDSAYASEMTYGDTQAYAALDGSSYLPTLKVKTSADYRLGSGAKAYAMQGYSYNGSEGTTIDLDLNLHGSVGDNSSSQYAHNSLRADIAVFIGDSLEWYTGDFGTLYYEFAYDMEKDLTSLFINDGMDVNEYGSLSFDLEPGQNFFIVASMQASSKNGFVDAWNTLSLDFADDSGLVAASAPSSMVDVPEPTPFYLLLLALMLIAFARLRQVNKL